MGRRRIHQNPSMIYPGEAKSRVPLPITEEERHAILSVAKCVSMVCIEDGGTDSSKRQYRFGTAFWISETRLLTACHIITDAGAKLNNIKVRVSPPCLSHVDPQILLRREMPSVECTVVARSHRDLIPDQISNYRDVAILDAGSYRPTQGNWLSLAAQIPSPTSTISVLGFPGYITPQWIIAHEGLNDRWRGQSTAESLLPTGHLTVTRGVAHESSGSIFRYNISTCMGMSGGCVLVEGQVVGKSISAETYYRHPRRPT